MKLEHLSCFYPGLLALGSELLNSTIKGSSEPELERDMRDRYAWAAESIAETCYLVCANNPTHVGHETVYFVRCSLILNAARIYSIVQTSGKNRNWWDEVDSWVKNGKGGGKPRGIHGKDTEKNIATDGVKGYHPGVFEWLMRT